MGYISVKWAVVLPRLPLRPSSVQEKWPSTTTVYTSASSSVRRVHGSRRAVLPPHAAIVPLQSPPSGRPLFAVQASRREASCGRTRRSVVLTMSSDSEVQSSTFNFFFLISPPIEIMYFIQTCKFNKI
jgi:hypothetical protein